MNRYENIYAVDEKKLERIIWKLNTHFTPTENANESSLFSFPSILLDEHILQRTIEWAQFISFVLSIDL